MYKQVETLRLESQDQLHLLRDIYDLVKRIRESYFKWQKTEIFFHKKESRNEKNTEKANLLLFFQT